MPLIHHTLPWCMAGNGGNDNDGEIDTEEIIGGTGNIAHTGAEVGTAPGYGAAPAYGAPGTGSKEAEIMRLKERLRQLEGGVRQVYTELTVAPSGAVFQCMASSFI